MFFVGVETEMSRNVNRRDTKCRHFTGYQNGTCKAQVNYREMVGGPDAGWAARLPCIPDSSLRKEPVAKCEKYATWTAEELAEQDREHEAHWQNMKTALAAIRATGKRQGEIDCPRCGGKLGFSVASNGHIWGKCKTEGCLAWMM
jgi:hypothetical protein